MALPREVMIASASSYQQGPASMLAIMFTLALGLIGILFVFAAVAQKGSLTSNNYFIIGVVFFVLAFLFNIGVRSMFK